VIKRITFADRADDVLRESAAAMSAPADARPVRATLCTAVPELCDGESKHDAIGLEWFSDVAHAERFEAWREAEGVRTWESCTMLVADELVLRGSEWLDRRWREGGEKLKHMAIARRARDLSPAEFSDRWRSHAGRLGSSGTPALVIPEVARGEAYVQNHPRPRPVGDWAYDAVNEVYFDDAGSLRARVDWFRANFDPAEDDLVRASWFVVAREEVLVQ
jgi:hypothetical protein